MKEWHLLTELRSLGLKVDRINELNDKQELGNLVETLWRTLEEHGHIFYKPYRT